MTFTIIGVCKRTKKVGYCQSTSTPAVGFRCADVVPGHGVFTFQASSDFRLKELTARLMNFGYSPAKVLKELKDTDAHFERRQIAIVGLDGVAVAHTGNLNLDWKGHEVGDGFVACGNALSGPPVVAAIGESFRKHANEDLEERLLRAIEAGRDAGGQPDGQVSAAMIVYGEHPFPLVNLRVDVSAEPIGELRKIFDWYRPLIPFYVQRTLDPSSVGRYKAFLADKGLAINPYKH